MTEDIRKVSRREFMQYSSATAAALAVGVYLESPEDAAADAPGKVQFAPNAFVAIDEQSNVSVWVSRSEMGQGVRTSLPAIVADELEADWDKIKVIGAPFDSKYGDQSTGGSMSMRYSYNRLRRAGAAAREMLIEAYSQKAGVPRGECFAEKGFVVHKPSGKRAAFGELVVEAAKLPVPENAPLKDPKDFRYIGKSIPMTNAMDKLNGAAKYGLDVRIPGMLVAAVAHCPVQRGTMKSYDAEPALKVPGVRHVVPVETGVAVVADNTWAAFKGREALKVTWDEGAFANESTQSLRQQFDKILSSPQPAFRNDGAADEELQKAKNRIEGVYELPYIAHAPLEPPNCIAWVQKDSCEMWYGSQIPVWAHENAKRITGLPAASVKINLPLLGGGFGRRGFPIEADEAVQISKKLGVPIQVVWDREDDLQHDFFRPASRHRMEAALDANGKPVAWRQRFSSTPIRSDQDPSTKHPEDAELGGAVNMPYQIPNVKVEYAPADSGLRRGWLRSVEHTFQAFVVESFIDEVAAAAGKDPYEFRLELLKEDRVVPYGDLKLETPRVRRVLNLVAQKSGWGSPAAKGRALGMASHFSFHTYMAQVAEVSIENGRPRVHRVVCAVDCGRVINPNGLRMQIEGGVSLALTTALLSEITVERGRVQQTNFDGYDLLHFGDDPMVEVHIVESEAPPTGIGEPCVPPLAPAVANALFRLTGKRYRQLPIKLS